MKKFPKKPAKIKTVYLDHAAATPTDPRVIKAMLPFFIKKFGNPSALYKFGRTSNEAISDARQTIAQILFTQPDTIIFTSGGTEANNLALFGSARALQKHGKHIITTAIEHHSVLQPLRQLEKENFSVTYLPTNKFGEINLTELKKNIRPDTVLITLMYANNEIGAINPIAAIGRELLKWRKKHNTPYPYFHTDACQAAPWLDLQVERLHVDLLTLNGSKIYGPKGVGVLFKRRGVNVAPLILGGGQERGLRSGTENVPAIVGMAMALALVQFGREKESKRLERLRNYFWQKIKTKIKDAQLNGPVLSLRNRLPNNLNFRFPNIEGETLVLYLDEYGIVSATGSACASDSLESSHVLQAIGLSDAEARDSVRFTLGKTTTKQEIDYVLKYLPSVIRALRATKIYAK